MNTSDEKMKIQTDPNFIAIKRFDFSLEKVLERYPDGCPDRVVAQALGMGEEDVELLYNHIISKLQHLIEPNDHLKP